MVETDAFLLNLLYMFSVFNDSFHCQYHSDGIVLILRVAITKSVVQFSLKH